MKHGLRSSVAAIDAALRCRLFHGSPIWWRVTEPGSERAHCAVLFVVSRSATVASNGRNCCALCDAYNLPASTLLRNNLTTAACCEYWWVSICVRPFGSLYVSWFIWTASNEWMFMRGWIGKDMQGREWGEQWKVLIKFVILQILIQVGPSE